jgi:hypothetical protein
VTGTTSGREATGTANGREAIGTAIGRQASRPVGLGPHAGIKHGHQTDLERWAGRWDGGASPFRSWMVDADYSETKAYWWGRSMDIAPAVC